MHVAGSSSSLDLNWFLQLIFTVFVIVLALLYLVKNTASKYFEVDANFSGGDANRHAAAVSPMPGLPMDDATCIVCGNPGTKKCSRCKEARYCSHKCQSEHWLSGHKTKCKVTSVQTAATNHGVKASGLGDKKGTSIALVPGGGTTSRIIKKPKEVLFPYEEFVKYFNWNKPGFTPCGLLNCGNSCFANVVLQCLTHTRPLVAYLLEKGHRRECTRNDWCFLCEFQTHVERASQSPQPFSPINILSRLPNIGGNLGYGRQEDAHEFMRFAIDTMQSVCLDEFGGEKAVHPSYQETTLIQHIFGGRLQSQVMCTKCNKISNQCENMMDLTVEIHGDVATLEECLDQFTVKEWLHGENMYKCDGCNDYVKAWKRLTVLQAPNILTIALKRFQSGRFGKLNKRVSFPETLDLSPYMSEAGDGVDVYKLYSVVVHIDMLNASYFGHYICYTKDFRGNWYRIDDCKVAKVDLDEVLSQGAYMLLYSRVSARPSCLKTSEPSEKHPIVEVEMEATASPKEVECVTSLAPNVGSSSSSESLSSDSCEQPKVSSCGKELYIGSEPEVVREHIEDMDDTRTSDSNLAVRGNGNGIYDSNSSSAVSVEVSSCKKEPFDSQALREGPGDTNIPNSGSHLSNGVSSCNNHLSTGESEVGREEAEPMDIDISWTRLSVPSGIEDHGNGHASPTEHAHKLVNGLSSGKLFSAEPQKMKHGMSHCSDEAEVGHAVDTLEMANDRS